MKKNLIIAWLACLVFLTGHAFAFTASSYTYVSYSTLGGAPTASPPLVVAQDSAQGGGAQSIFGGQPWWASSGVGISLSPNSSHGWAEIAADPVGGSIHSLTRARNFIEDGNKVGWDAGVGGASFYYEPQNWGTAHSFAYIRSVWQVTSESLPTGSPISTQLSVGVEGEFSGDLYLDNGNNDNINHVRAAFMLQSLDNPSAWFNKYTDFGEYLDFGGFDDFELSADKEYDFYNSSGSLSDGKSSINETDIISGTAEIGDILVLEILFQSDSILLNGGYSHEALADFANTVHSTLSTDTPGAQLVYVSSPVPIPGTIWLLASGMIGLAGFRSRKKFRF